MSSITDKLSRPIKEKFLSLIIFRLPHVQISADISRLGLAPNMWVVEAPDGFGQGDFRLSASSIFPLYFDYVGLQLAK
jgi:hypothetical protein